MRPDFYTTQVDKAEGNGWLQSAHRGDSAAVREWTGAGRDRLSDGSKDGWQKQLSSTTTFHHHHTNTPKIKAGTHTYVHAHSDAHTHAYTYTYTYKQRQSLQLRTIDIHTVYIFIFQNAYSLFSEQVHSHTKDYLFCVKNTLHIYLNIQRQREIARESERERCYCMR